MANLYRVFRDLIPEPPLLVGTLITLHAGGCSVELPDGSVVTARGTGTVGQKVFVRDGVIDGAAPDLTVMAIEI